MIYIYTLNLDHCAVLARFIKIVFILTISTQILYGVVAHFGEQVGRKRGFYERFCCSGSSVVSTLCSTPPMEGAVLRSFADGFEGVRYMSGINKKEKEENCGKGKT